MRYRRTYLIRQQRLARFGFASYRAYLASAHWRATKRAYRESDLPQACYCCGEWETELHHRTYERIGAEPLSDLTPLCHRCHALVHTLERRGDLGIDLEGLLDQQRAAANAEATRQRESTAQREFDAAHSLSAQKTKSVAILMKNLLRITDDDELGEAFQTIYAGLDEIEALIRAEAA